VRLTRLPGLEIPALERATLLRIILIAVLFGASVAIYRGYQKAEATASRPLPRSVWREGAYQQLIRPDMVLRLSLFSEEVQSRLRCELPRPVQSEHLYDIAVAGYERLVLTIGNENPYAKARLGIIYALDDYHEQAQALFLKASAHDPDHEAVYLALARLFSPDVEEAADIEGVLPQLRRLPRWLQDLTVPYYYEMLVENEWEAQSVAVELESAPTGEAAEGANPRAWPLYVGGPQDERLSEAERALAAAEKAAEAHQWRFGMWALLPAITVFVLLCVSLWLIGRALWRGAFGTVARQDSGREQIPFLVPWHLLDAVEVLVVLRFGLVVLGVLGGLAVKQLGEAASDPTTQAALIGTQYVLFIIAGFAVMMRRVSSADAEKLGVLGLRVKDGLRPLVLSGVGGYSVYVLFLTLQGLTVQQMPVLNLEVAQLGMKLLGEQSAASVIIYVVLLGLLAPVAEELIFRGFIYSSLRRYVSALPAVVVSAVVFGLMHPGGTALLQIVVIGIVLAVLYERTRSVIPCIVCHAMNNLLAFGLILLANQ
jgi:membrane protease YdiL (CAAX protease family)